MATKTYRAYDPENFPLEGGIYQSKSQPAIMEMKKRGLAPCAPIKIRRKVQLGSKTLPKGAKLGARVKYQIRNLTQDYVGKLELMGIEAKGAEPRFVVALDKPLISGDRIEVSFVGV